MWYALCSHCYTVDSDPLHSPQSGVHRDNLEWLNDASQLLIYRRLKQQEAKINKRWRVAAFEQAKESARCAIAESNEMDRKLKEVADRIEAAGHTIVWESPKHGIFLPYILRAEGNVDQAYLFVSGSNVVGRRRNVHLVI